MATGAAVAAGHADGAFEDAFRGDLLANATQGAPEGGAQRLGLFGEGSIRMEFWHAPPHAADVPSQLGASHLVLTAPADMVEQ
jgi:hypothetical protein